MLTRLPVAQPLKAVAELQVIDMCSITFAFNSPILLTDSYWNAPLFHVHFYALWLSRSAHARQMLISAPDFLNDRQPTSTGRRRRIDLGASFSVSKSAESPVANAPLMDKKSSEG